MRHALPVVPLALTLLLAGIAQAQIVTPLQADEHTLLLYHFDGDGDTIIDSGPLGLNGAVIGGEVARTEGIVGRALTLADGQAVTIPTPEALRGLEQITVETWFRTTDPDPMHRQRLVLYWEHYLISIFEGGRLTGHLYDQDVGKFIARGHQPIIPGRWYHTALTWDGERVRLWLNGRVEATLRMSGTINPVPGAGLQLGSAGTDSFIGQIDELRISSIARPAFPEARRMDFCRPSETLLVSPGFARMLFDPLMPAGTGPVECTATLGDLSATATIAPDDLQPVEGSDLVAGVSHVELRIPEGQSGDAILAGAMSYQADGQTVHAAREVPVRIEPVVPVPATEFRAAWTHSHRIEEPEDILARMEASGLNAAIMRVRRGETAYYRSALGPISEVPFENETLLQDCAAAAKRHGIDLHLYVNNFPVGSPDSEIAQQMRADGRWQKNSAGEDVAWLCPSHPANLELVEAAMVELARDYDIAGVQYDFIRYGGDDVCFCDRCRAGFEERVGRAVDWPAECLAAGALHEDWLDYRASLITEAVRRTSAAIRAVNDDLVISAAVFAMPPEQAKAGVGQDWALWCREGLLDALCPMSYTPDNAAYEVTVSTILDAVGEYVPVYAGIGLRSGSGVMRYPEQFAAKLNTLRRLGAPGFSAFCVTPPTDAPETVLIPLRETMLAGDGRGEPQPD